MTKPKHVPECFNGRQRSGGLPCICDRLRACEERVREEESRNVIGSVSLAAIAEANLQQYQLGFSEGLDAAREAIEALVQNPDAEVDYHRDYTADRTGHMRNPRIWVREAVAAIKELGADR